MFVFSLKCFFKDSLQGGDILAMGTKSTLQERGDGGCGVGETDKQTEAYSSK